MMNPDRDLLQQLHDIHLPPALTFWPVAPGWYVVVGILLLTGIVSAWWGWRWFDRGKVKRAALKILAQYEKEYIAASDALKSGSSPTSRLSTPTSRGLTAGFRSLTGSLDPAVKPREVGDFIASQEVGKNTKPLTQTTSAALNELLKRVALAYFPREQVAPLHGKDWLLFLNNTSQQIDFFAEQDALLLCPYQPNCERDLQPLFDLVRVWIGQREKPCLS